MIEAAVYGVLLGIGVYVGTAMLMGTQKANNMPGGAIAGAILLSPWYVAMPAALVGHIIAVVVTKMVKR
jgi:hypothetical protein